MCFRARIAVQAIDGQLPSFSRSSMGTQGVPHPIAALLQGGYWSNLSPDRLYAYSHFLAAGWLAGTGLLALVVSCLCTGKVLGAPSRRQPVAVTAVLWTLGRVVGAFMFVYYLLAVTTVYQLWAVDFATGSRAAVAWVVGLLVLVAPLAAVLAAVAVSPTASTVGAGTMHHVVLGPLVAPFRPGCLWFGCAVLADRLLYAVVVVVASAWPVLQLVLVVARSLVFLALLVGLRPFRNPGVQQFSVAMAVVRALVLCLSVAFIPHAATHNPDRVLAVGYAVALVHVVTCAGVALLAVLKVYRTCTGRHACGDAGSGGAPTKATASGVLVCAALAPVRLRTGWSCVPCVSQCLFVFCFFVQCSHGNLCLFAWQLLLLDGAVLCLLCVCSHVGCGCGRSLS
jgi:hypothetical protein